MTLTPSGVQQILQALADEEDPRLENSDELCLVSFLGAYHQMMAMYIYIYIPVKHGTST